MTARADAFIFFLALFFTLSSGHLGSFDAFQQLRSSVLLASTGSLGLDPAHGDIPGWVRAPNGRGYEPHDLGNALLFLPASAALVRGASRPLMEMVWEPPLVLRAAAGLMPPVLAALGCVWMMQLCAAYVGTRAAFAAALAFALATPFAAYARTAWDVMPGAAFLCGMLAAADALLRGRAPARSALLCAAALALACTFRFSLLPFFGPATLVVFAIAVQQRRLTPRAAVLAGVLLVALLAPSFVYNFVRTGSPLRPATAAPQYLNHQNALNGPMLVGLTGLLVSPNRGLFVFSPLLLLSIAAPWAWRRLAGAQRVVLSSYGAAAAAHTLLMAKIVSWDVFGWGPRYMVPVLPVVFFAAACVAMTIADRPVPRRIAIALAACALLVSLPAMIVDWPQVTAAAQDAWRPTQIPVAWGALLHGVSPVYPDWFLWRLAQLSPASAVAAASAALAAVASMTFTGSRIWRIAS